MEERIRRMDECRCGRAYGKKCLENLPRLNDCGMRRCICRTDRGANSASTGVVNADPISGGVKQKKVM